MRELDFCLMSKQLVTAKVQAIKRIRFPFPNVKGISSIPHAAPSMKPDTPMHTPDLSSRTSGNGSEGYLTSSLDLQAGLRVREILISALPHEVIHELARMRRAWPVAREVAQAA